MAITKTPRTIVSSQTRTAGGASVRGTIDLETAYGGFLTLKITNGATGPAAQCVGKVLIAHNSTLPSAAAAGTDWKTIYTIGGGLTANAVTEIGIPIDPSIMALEIEFDGNTSQDVTVESFMSELTSI